MTDTEYVYYTVQQGKTVTVRSGSNPTPNTQISLNSYKLKVISSQPGTPIGNNKYTFGANTPLTVEQATGRAGVSDPNWTYNFNVSTDDTIQVTQVVPDP